MRRLKIGLLICLCALLSTPAFGYFDRDNAVVSTYEVNNSTGEYQRTDVPTALIPRNSRILGMVVMQFAAGNSENVLSLYDTVGTTDDIRTVSEVIAEAEASTNENNEVWFEYPRKVNQQLTVVQGANTSIQIYFEK